MPPEDDDSADGEEGGVLAPEELDISDDENAVEIEEGRYVISAGGGPPSVPPGVAERSSPDSSVGDDIEADRDSADRTAGELTAEDVHDWLEASVGDARSQYGFDVTAKFEGGVSRQELYSNDVSTTFENLIVWYAQHVGGETPVEEVLGILLSESNVSIRYPPATIRGLTSQHGLSADDSIADLLDAIEDRDSVTFPP